MKIGCGYKEQQGWNDFAICGKPYYDEPTYLCSNCKTKEIEFLKQALQRQVARADEAYDLLKRVISDEDTSCDPYYMTEELKEAIDKHLADWEGQA